MGKEQLKTFDLLIILLNIKEVNSSERIHALHAVIIELKKGTLSEYHKISNFSACIYVEC